MRKYFGVAAVVVFLAALALAFWQGGRDPFVSPVSSIPSILIDHNLNEPASQNETEIYVKGLNDFRYDNMTMRITSANQTIERVKQDAYFIFLNTSLTDFIVNVTVWTGNREYTFNGSVEVASEGEGPLVMTLHEDKKGRTNTYSLNADTLPWKKFMERVQ